MSSTDRILETIHKLFISCSDFNLFDWQGIIDYIKADKNSQLRQDKVLRATSLHYLNKTYPVKESYQQLFLKTLIFQLETCGEEVSDCVYNCFAEKVACGRQQEFFYSHYRLNKEIYVSIQRAASFVTEGTTGLSTWEGGLALAEWAAQHPSLCAGKRVLELGCGLGLCGVTVCVLGRPLTYTFTDCHQRVLSVLHHNLSLNSTHLVHTAISTQLLDWEDTKSYQLPEPVDIVLAADVVFDTRLFPGLVNTLLHFLSRSAFAVLACTERNPPTLAAFLQCLAQKNIEVQELQSPQPSLFNFSTNPPIRIYRCNYGESS